MLRPDRGVAAWPCRIAPASRMSPYPCASAVRERPLEQRERLGVLAGAHAHRGARQGTPGDHPRVAALPPCCGSSARQERGPVGERRVRRGRRPAGGSPGSSPDLVARPRGSAAAARRQVRRIRVAAGAVGDRAPRAPASGAASLGPSATSRPRRAGTASAWSGEPSAAARSAAARSAIRAWTAIASASGPRQRRGTRRGSASPGPRRAPRRRAPSKCRAAAGAAPGGRAGRASRRPPRAGAPGRSRTGRAQVSEGRCRARGSRAARGRAGAARGSAASLPATAAERVERERLAEHGGVLDEGPSVRLEAVEAGGDERSQRARHLHRAEVARRDVDAVELLGGVRRRRACGPSRRRTAGCRPRAARIDDTAVSGSPGTRPARSARISSSASGPSASDVEARAPPHVGRRSSSSGRARVRTKIGWLRLHSRTCSMKSSSPSSAHWRSSNTRATVPFSAIRSKNVRQPAKSRSRPPGGASATPRRASRQGSMKSRSAGSGTCVARAAATPARVVASSSPSTRPARLRTISPSAQKLIPSPYDGQRPWCHQTVSTTPSVYLLNSQARRLLPMPAWPDERDEARLAIAARSRGTSRAGGGTPSRGRRTAAPSASERPTPPILPTTRRARNAATGALLPLRHGVAGRLVGDRLRGRPPRLLADQDGLRRGHRLEARGRVDEVAGHEALVRGPDGHRRLAGEDARAQAQVGARRRSPRARIDPTRSSAARTARSASSSWATGAPQTAITASPMNFSIVPP